MKKLSFIVLFLMATEAYSIESKDKSGTTFRKHITCILPCFFRSPIPNKKESKEEETFNLENNIEVKGESEYNVENSKPNREVSFNLERNTVHTVKKVERKDPLLVYPKTGADLNKIYDELNTFKRTMEVHEESREMTVYH